ncbi:DUF262 domain-containing protein [Helicobacter sp. WB40]|uniref:DUF262 domain-containing protein n=1 Tax=Helicobacter sp. WB40 TaxID=3004130 RepID=UPI0022EBE7A9|nr:DUF262 domain-containing protein [Helicobacter sp. WB40]MDA3967099.1 DUF262 domain-containing protein [Helicobacter sp. WB40]
MIAETNNFEFIRDNKTRVIVPFFQRPYVWKKDHWKQLLSDLKDSFKENRSIFLGFIILKENDKKIYSIIDGQQRLTTCSILIKILYDFLEQEQRDELDLRNYLFDKTNIKINHSKLDKKNMKKL